MAAAVSAAGRAPLAAGDADRRTDSPSEAADEAGSRAADDHRRAPYHPAEIAATGVVHRYSQSFNKYFK
ncbi:hypothetical protein GCM10018953_47400 [Streptosporangium nondiastaticum]